MPFDEIKENGFDLNIGRYVRAAVEEAADLDGALHAYAVASTARMEAERRCLTASLPPESRFRSDSGSGSG